MSKPASLAGLMGLAALGAQAQIQPPVVTSLDPVVVTATRALGAKPTLRDATVITREDLDGAGNLSLGEVLERYAGIELRATGGPGQPQGLFMRGAGTAQTLVLVDGMRVGSATVGTTSIENIPIELVERIEVVKGPLSSLWGSDAIGGVVQVFTRGKDKPHFFVSSALGSDSDRRIAAGITTIDKGTSAVLSIGYREVDAPSATTDRVPFCHDPDRDPHDNTFANLRVAQRLWQGENLAFEAFGTRGRTSFDGCGTGDRNDQVIAGARVTSSSQFSADWLSRLAASHSRDRIEITGGSPDRFETRRDQVSWVNEIVVPMGTLVLGVEGTREQVSSDSTEFTINERTTRSFFTSINESWQGQRLEASWRYDDDDSFGRRNTGSVGYGLEFSGGYLLSATVGRGFRAPTFYDLFGPASDFYQPNPALSPEKSESREVTLKSTARGALAWRATVFDNRIEDMITYVFPTVLNVARARIKGLELAADATYWGIRWRAAFTAQRPRDDITGAQLQGRGERFGTLAGTWTRGDWTVGGTLHASDARFDSTDENAASRLGGYATLDARVRYRIDRHWSAELSATNLTDKRYETAVGYEGARRSVLLALRFEAF